MEPETNNNGSNNAKVMIAEDDVSLMEIMSMQLKKKGYNVISATNGKKAVEMVREVNPDILLLDLLMPEMDGFEVLQYMQENDIHVPTMVLTNLGQEQNCDKSKELGAIDCCVKSDTPLNLLATKIEGILKSVGK